MSSGALVGKGGWLSGGGRCVAVPLGGGPAMGKQSAVTLRALIWAAESFFSWVKSVSFGNLLTFEIVKERACISR